MIRCGSCGFSELKVVNVRTGESGWVRRVDRYV